jgi:hypothetical protein
MMEAPPLPPPQTRPLSTMARSWATWAGASTASRTVRTHCVTHVAAGAAHGRGHVALTVSACGEASQARVSA